MAGTLEQMGSMNDYYALRLYDRNLLIALQDFVWRWFRGDNWLNVENYRNVVASAQDGLNEFSFARCISHDVRKELSNLLGAENLMVQSNLYLRAARPNMAGQEAVDWHRESFYGCQPQAWNIWMPVMNCTPENSIRYVPGSAAIPDENIKLAEGESDGVERFSSGHKIGLLYAPKTIVGGVDFSTAKTFDVKEGEVAVFPSSLIHGAAQNKTDKIRFSIDFRVIAREHVAEQKKSFAGGGQDFFVPLAA